MIYNIDKMRILKMINGISVALRFCNSTKEFKGGYITE